MADPSSKKTLRDVWRMLFRYRWRFSVSASVVAVAVLFGAPPFWRAKYTGEAKFERRLEVAAQDMARGKSEVEAMRSTILQELKGPTALENAVQELEKNRLVDPLPRTEGKLTAEGRRILQDTVRAFEETLKVTMEVRSEQVDLVSVEFTHSDPRLAQAIPNTVVTNFMERAGQRIIDGLTTSRDFLLSKVNDARTRLAELTGKRLQFEARFANAFPDSPGAIQQQIQRFEADLDRARREQDSAKKKLGRLRAIGAITYPESAASGIGPATAKEGVAPDGNTLGPDGGTAAPGGTASKTGPAAPPAGGAATASTGAKPVEGTPVTPGAKPVEGPPATPGAKPPEETAGTPPAREIVRKSRIPNPEKARLQEELRQYKKVLDEARTLAHMTEKHPRVIALTKQIAETEKRLQEMPEMVDREEVFLLPDTPGAEAVSADPQREEQFRREREQREEQARRNDQVREAVFGMQIVDAEAEISNYQGEAQRLEEQLNKWRDLLTNFSGVRQEYLQMIDEGKQQQNELDNWQKRLNEVQMALAAEAAKRGTRLSQVELAREQYVPSSPKPYYVIALAILGGLAVGAGLVFLFHTLDRSIGNAEQATAHFHLPVYGVVDEIVTPRQRRLRWLRAYVLSPVFALVVLVAVGVGTANVWWWLKDRDAFDKWKATPYAFLWEETSRCAQDAIEAMKGQI